MSGSQALCTLFARHHCARGPHSGCLSTPESGGVQKCARVPFPAHPLSRSHVASTFQLAQVASTREAGAPRACRCPLARVSSSPAAVFAAAGALGGKGGGRSCLRRARRSACCTARRARPSAATRAPARPPPPSCAGASPSPCAARSSAASGWRGRTRPPPFCAARSCRACRTTGATLQSPSSQSTQVRPPPAARGAARCTTGLGAVALRMM